jgi:hypothetical protein
MRRRDLDGIAYGVATVLDAMPPDLLHGIGRALVLASKPEQPSTRTLALLGGWLAFWDGVNPLQLIRLRLFLRRMTLDTDDANDLVDRLGSAEGQPWETLLAGVLAARELAAQGATTGTPAFDRP